MHELISHENKRTVLITGGTSGIGAAYATAFAAKGYDLVLVSIESPSITRSIIDSLEKRYDSTVVSLTADLSKDRDIKLLERFIKKRNDIEVLINCAGFGLGKKFEEADLIKEDDMLKVHCHAPINLMRAVLPQMRDQGKGVIINVSSLGGFLPMIKNSVYGGTKAFLITFTESLHMELKGSGIKVQVIAPGFVKTHFHDKMKNTQNQIKEHRFLNWMTTDQVVRASMKYLRKGKVICIPGWKYRFLCWLSKSVPRTLYYKIFGNVI
jgi:short-subunit dehydrogenase